jgi:hypothetical protein
MPSLQPPVFEDEASLFSLATEYLEAAEILARTPPVKVNVSLVTFYLLGHAAELLLKSLLHKHGVPLQDLKDRKKYGHNLGKLVEQSRGKGFIAPTFLLNVEAFSKTYTPKHTEYRQKVAMSLPPLESLLQELRALQSQVFNHVALFQSGA